MKKYLFLLIPVICVSCFSYHEKPFEVDGIAFTIPEGWAVSDDKEENGSERVIVCKRKGFNNNGLVTIVWVNDSIPLDQMLEIYKSGLKENIILKYSTQVFEPSHEGSFNKYKCLLSNYSLTLLNLPHKGALYCFYEKKKTISILTQGPLKDTLKDNLGFKKIEETFLCK